MRERLSSQQVPSHIPAGRENISRRLCNMPSMCHIRLSLDVAVTESAKRCTRDALWQTTVSRVGRLETEARRLLDQGAECGIMRRPNVRGFPQVLVHVNVGEPRHARPEAGAVVTLQAVAVSLYKHSRCRQR